MPVSQGILVAILGFGVVFFMLCILWAVIAIVARIEAVLAAKKKVAAEAEAPAAAAATATPNEVAYGSEVQLYDVDEKTAACIMAIVSDETKIPLAELKFKSIKSI